MLKWIPLVQPEDGRAAWVCLKRGDTGIPPNFVNVYHNLHHTPCKNGECEAILGGVISIFRHTPHRSFCFTFIKLMLQTVQRRPMNYCNSAGFRDRNPEWTTKCWAHTLPKIAKVDSVVHMYVYNCVYIYLRMCILSVAFVRQTHASSHFFVVGDVNKVVPNI